MIPKVFELFILNNASSYKKFVQNRKKMVPGCVREGWAKIIVHQNKQKIQNFTTFELFSLIAISHYNPAAFSIVSYSKEIGNERD